MKLPLRAVPRDELEINGFRIIEDGAGHEVGFITFDEDAEDLVNAANNYERLRRTVKSLLGALDNLGFNEDEGVSGADTVDVMDYYNERLIKLLEAK